MNQLLNIALQDPHSHSSDKFALFLIRRCLGSLSPMFMQPCLVEPDLTSVFSHRKNGQTIITVAKLPCFQSTTSGRCLAANMRSVHGHCGQMERCMISCSSFV